MRFRAGWLGVAVAALAVAPDAAATPGKECQFYGINPGAPTWNGKVLLDDKLAAALAASGAGAVRINFRLEGAAWDGAALASYDAIVDRVKKQGLEPLGLLAYEGVPGGQAAWNDDLDGDGFNPYVDAFANTSKLLFAHFKGRITRWEIWNEPNCWSNPGYASDPKNAGCTYLLPRVFAKMMAECYVRSAALVDAGDVTLVSGGLFAHDIGGSFSTAADYLGDVYGNGVWDWLKANTKRHYAWGGLGYHLYLRQGQTADAGQLASYLDAVRAAAKAHGDGAPFSVTELGWTTKGVSPAVQAANVAIAYGVLEARADVSDGFWFSYGDAPAADLYFGLVDGGGSAKPALKAFQDEAAGCMSTSAGGAESSASASTAATTSAATSTSASASGGGGPIGEPPVGAAGAGGASGNGEGPGGAAGCGCRWGDGPVGGGAAAALVALMAAARSCSSGSRPRSRRRSRCAR